MSGELQDPRRDEPGREDGEVRAAARFALLTAIAGTLFVAVAAFSVSDCDGATATDTAACGALQRALLGAGGPLILLIGGIWAFGRTYQVWRRRGTWWGWQGAGWFLMTLMLVALMMALPPIAGVPRN